MVFVIFVLVVWVVMARGNEEDQGEGPKMALSEQKGRKAERKKKEETRSHHNACSWCVCVV